MYFISFIYVASSFIEQHPKYLYKTGPCLVLSGASKMWPVNSPHKWPVTRKIFPFDDVIMDLFFLGILKQVFFSKYPILGPTFYSCFLFRASGGVKELYLSFANGIDFVCDCAKKTTLPDYITHICVLLVNMQGHSQADVLVAVSIRKTVLPGMAIPMLKIRRPNGRLIFNMEIAIRR